MIMMKYQFEATVEEESFQKNDMIFSFFEKRLGEAAGYGSGTFVKEDKLIKDGELLFDKVSFEVIELCVIAARRDLSFAEFNVMKMVKDEEGDWIVE